MLENDGINILSVHFKGVVHTPRSWGVKINTVNLKWSYSFNKLFL